MEPVFESQTKTKLGSTEMGGGLPTVRSYILEFISKNLDNYLHKNKDVAEESKERSYRLREKEKNYQELEN